MGQVDAIVVGAGVIGLAIARALALGGQPGYAGIRPKLAGPGEPAADFVIAGPESHGLAGLVNLFGFESPGLTACLAVAREVAERLD